MEKPPGVCIVTARTELAEGEGDERGDARNDCYEGTACNVYPTEDRNNQSVGGLVWLVRTQRKPLLLPYANQTRR